MKILLTGANGYIGKRLLPVLLEKGHEVVCCVRNRLRLPQGGIYSHPGISIIEVDFLKRGANSVLSLNIDVAYYLIHSMSAGEKDFEKLEELSAINFLNLVSESGAKQIVYLSGIVNEEKLSKHLSSRKRVEEILLEGGIPVTTLRAGIIVGSGSASFEIIRDLVEKLPVMITPKWLNTRHQPIAIRDVIKYLTGVLLKEETFNKSYDIGGPDILTYREMLLIFARARGLRRLIFTVPVMTPRLSSYWLYFVTATSYELAVNLVNSMKIEVICRDSTLQQMLDAEPISYRTAVELAFEKIEQNMVISSWKDALVSSTNDTTILNHIDVPEFGCFTDRKRRIITQDQRNGVIENIWAIGGERGWYYADFLWQIRGFLDKIVGGVGLRRGRTNPRIINTGDTLDFWRVIVANKTEGRLLLYAEMKLPGEAWLEFRVDQSGNLSELVQTATFRPRGLSGRLYWYSVLPFHYFIFNGMIRKIISYRDEK